jgi:hypothetical protein
MSTSPKYIVGRIGYLRIFDEPPLIWEQKTPAGKGFAIGRSGLTPIDVRASSERVAGWNGGGTMFNVVRGVVHEGESIAREVQAAACEQIDALARNIAETEAQLARLRADLQTVLLAAAKRGERVRVKTTKATEG